MNVGMGNIQGYVPMAQGETFVGINCSWLKSFGVIFWTGHSWCSLTCPVKCLHCFSCQDCSLMRLCFGSVHECIPPLDSTSAIRDNLLNTFEMIHSGDGMMDCSLWWPMPFFKARPDIFSKLIFFFKKNYLIKSLIKWAIHCWYYEGL